MAGKLSARPTALLRFVKDGLTEVALILPRKRMARAWGGAVTVDNKPAKFQHDKSRIQIALDPPSKAGKQRTFKIVYHGVPASGLHIGSNKYGERTFFSGDWPDKARR